MTPEEAREKWCPFARVQQICETNNHKVVAASVNRLDNGRPLSGAHCIADKCALWRWLPLNPDNIRRGFCGLAGQPR